LLGLKLQFISQQRHKEVKSILLLLEQIHQFSGYPWQP